MEKRIRLLIKPSWLFPGKYEAAIQIGNSVHIGIYKQLRQNGIREGWQDLTPTEILEVHKIFLLDPEIFLSRKSERDCVEIHFEGLNE